MELAWIPWQSYGQGQTINYPSKCLVTLIIIKAWFYSVMSLKQASDLQFCRKEGLSLLQVVHWLILDRRLDKPSTTIRERETSGHWRKGRKCTYTWSNPWNPRTVYKWMEERKSEEFPRKQTVWNLVKQTDVLQDSSGYSSKSTCRNWP